MAWPWKNSKQVFTCSVRTELCQNFSHPSLIWTKDLEISESLLFDPEKIVNISKIWKHEGCVQNQTLSLFINAIFNYSFFHIEVSIFFYITFLGKIHELLNYLLNFGHTSFFSFVVWRSFGRIGAEYCISTRKSIRCCWSWFTWRVWRVSGCRPYTTGKFNPWKCNQQILKYVCTAILAKWNASFLC